MKDEILEELRKECNEEEMNLINRFSKTFIKVYNISKTKTTNLIFQYLYDDGHLF